MYTSRNGQEEDKERSGIIDMVGRGDILLADRGFNIQGLFLDKGVTLVIPPFLKFKYQFSDADKRRTKQDAHTWIHIECVIGRIKDFDIRKSERPLDMFDIFDDVVVVAAFINLHP